jgi:hypothetical protein
MSRVFWILALGIAVSLFAEDPPAPTKVEGIPLILGSNTFGECNVPAGLCNVTAISLSNHVVALKSDGTVVAWGRNTAGQCNVPAGLSGVVAVAAGAEHTLALKSDGTVVAWGSNADGECNVPAGLNGIRAVAAGYSAFFGSDTTLWGFSVALKADGIVTAWGNNSAGQSNVPAGLTGVAAIAACGPLVGALKSDGSVVAWGRNFGGSSDVPAGLSQVMAVVAGNDHMAALKLDGTVVMWGDNQFGQCSMPTGLSGVVAIAAGGFHTAALKSDGTIVAWGRNDQGQCNCPLATGVSSIQAGFRNTAILFSGTLPTARFTCSDVVGFVGLPLAFDATYSTDPENQIKTYDWDFGDGSPHGSEKIMAKTYFAPGTYAVTLTIKDGDGLIASTTRNVVVLAASEAGLFNGYIKYKVKWTRTAQNADSLTFEANVNAGDVTVGKDTAVAIEIAGQRFTGTLDAKLRDSTNANCKWQVKAGTRNQAFGEVNLKAKIKKASLGLGFNLAGAVVGVDPHELVTLDIPVRIEIAGRIFEVSVSSDFKFSADGKKAAGEGEGQ